MMKTDKHIYACGCSFTEKNWKKPNDWNNPDIGELTGGWPMWPEILGNHLGLPVVNFGKGGMGNDYILAVSMKYILDNHKDIKLVAIAWSQGTRHMVYDKHHFNPSVWLEGDPNDWYINTKNPGYRFYENPYSHSQYLMNWLNSRHELHLISDRYVRHVYTLQRLCEELNLRYIFAAALNPLQLYEWQFLDDFDAQKELHQFTKADNFYDINTNNFIGWPVHEELGGKNLCSGVEFQPYGKNRVPNDPHPDKNGQRIIAQQYIDHYENK